MKLVCFDVDGTLIDGIESIWRSMHKKQGIDRVLINKWYGDYMKGRVSYHDWVLENIRWWQAAGAHKQDFVELANSLSLMNGARATISELKRRNIKVAVISGSIDIVLHTLFPDKPFDYVFINEFSFDWKGKITAARPTAYDFEHKAEAMMKIAKKEEIPMSEVVFVGDHQNDIEAVKMAGLGIAFNSHSKELSKAADVVIKKKDMREILSHLTL